MKKILLALGAVMAIALTVPSADAIMSSDYHGWLVHGDPAGTSGTFMIGEPVTAYATLATFSGNAEWYPWDRVTNEYTAVITSTVTDVQTNVGTTTVVFATATVTIYEDPSKNADYQTPSTFTDGTLLLTGTLTNWVATRLNPGDPGYVSGCDPGVAPGPCPTLTWNGGPGLSNVDCPDLYAFLNDAYTFDGVVLEPGYTELFDAEWKCREPVSVDPSTWGRVKTIYR